MQRRTIKIIIIVAMLIVLVAGAVSLILLLRPKTVHGRIDFGTEYYLTEMRDNVFDGVTINADSYILLNEDRQTGELALVGLPNNKINFIITNYTEGETTTFEIEFIYKQQLQHLTATSNDAEVRFKQVQSAKVDITQEHPDETTEISYPVTIMVFAKEVVA